MCFWQSELVWGRSRARFDCKNIWFSHNLELVTDATDATDATEPGGEGEVVSRPATRTPHPTRTGGQDDGSYTQETRDRQETDKRQDMTR